MPIKPEVHYYVPMEERLDFEPVRGLIRQRKYSVLYATRQTGKTSYPLAQGLTQTRAYLDRCGAEEGHLLIFDRDPKRSWEEKIWEKEVEGIKVWGA